MSFCEVKNLVWCFPQHLLYSSRLLWALHMKELFVANSLYCCRPNFLFLWSMLCSENQRMAAVERDLWRSLAEPTAPRAGHSVFYPVKLWICSRMETMQPLWSAAPIFDHPNFSKVIQISNGNTLCCSLRCYFPSFHRATLLTSKNFPCFSQSDMTAWSGRMLIGSFLIVFSLTPSTTKHQFLIALFLNRSRQQKHLLPENSDKAPMFLQTRFLAFPVLSSWC